MFAIQCNSGCPGIDRFDRQGIIAKDLPLGEATDLLLKHKKDMGHDAEIIDSEMTKIRIKAPGTRAAGPKATPESARPPALSTAVNDVTGRSGLSSVQETMRDDMELSSKSGLTLVQQHKEPERKHQQLSSSSSRKKDCNHLGTVKIKFGWKWVGGKKVQRYQCQSCGGTCLH